MEAGEDRKSRTFLPCSRGERGAEKRCIHPQESMVMSRVMFNVRSMRVPEHGAHDLFSGPKPKEGSWVKNYT